MVFVFVGALSQAAPESKEKEKAAAPAQKTFATPEEAATALVAAATTYDLPTLIQILGPDGKDLVSTDDLADDKIRAARFATLAREKMSLALDSSRRRADLLIGNDDWPMPIPIVKQKNGTWFYDSITGREEVLVRRIGENELNAIAVCRGFVEAQHGHASTTA